ncbi:MAG: SpoIIE family protein phosphatase [Clostridiales bacterium]|nr:SpoIIE family protein phosphatase [Clostridiales bacterium]
MVAGESGIAEVTIDKKKVYLAYEPLTTLGWSFATVIEQEEVIAPAIESQDGIMKLTNGAISQINQNIGMVFVILIVLVMIVLLAIFFLSTSVSKKITDPIVRVTQAVQGVGDGNLEYNLEIHTGDETEELSNAFQEMTSKLKEYIKNLTAVTAEKERIGAELNVATQIQASMLPCIFPAFPEHKEFNVYATMQPAKEVGGDFYDFFLTDDNHLAVVMADVSGKGVPAALFMVIAKTLIKNHTQSGEAPSDVFTNVNKQLCENNQAGMFVTAWMGILEIDSGLFTYVNAGHNPPLLKRKGEGFVYLKSRAGFVLAGMEGIRYRQNQIQLNQGDLLYLYTDGVTEATDIYNELYGEERLQQILDHNAGLPLEEILKNIKQSIDFFVKGAPQFDDITMLALEIYESK